MTQTPIPSDRSIRFVTLPDGADADCMQPDHNPVTVHGACGRCREHCVCTVCPDPKLHQVADAPLRPLSDLLRAAVELDEIADIVRDHSDLTLAEQGRFDALRVAVRRLQ